MSQKCHNNDIQIMHKGKWIQAELITYTDPTGTKRQWESARYVRNPPDPKLPNSVLAVPILKRNLHHNCFVLVKQFRPPIGKYCIEFPGGMCDKSGETLHAVALRELYEETGYTGLIADETVEDLPLSLDPGVESCTSALVNIVVDGDDPKNIECKPHLDEGEFTEIILLPVRGLLGRLKQLVCETNNELMVDSRVYTLALGMEMGEAMNSKSKVADSCGTEGPQTVGNVYLDPK